MYWNQSIATGSSVNEETSYEEPIQESSDLNDDGSGIVDTDSLLETYLVDLMDRMSDEQLKAYAESQEFQDLLEAGVAGRRSITRLNKQDDLTRRVNLASIQKAREMGDANWEALRKNRIRERELLDKIYKRWGNQVRRDAIASQKRLIKLSPRAFDMTRAVR